MKIDAEKWAKENHRSGWRKDPFEMLRDFGEYVRNQYAERVKENNTPARSEGNLEVVFPWNVPPLDKWAIIGMNHYHANGKRHLFVSMGRNGMFIKAEGVDEREVFEKLRTLLPQPIVKGAIHVRKTRNTR